ncbi:MAG: HNH endonuclease [Gemmataceae bacterium]
MDLPDPFAYPATPHARRHGPLGYENYGSFKPFLRDEFTFRCVYCLERERWYPNRGASFSADHFTPKAIDPARETDYDNLVYACTRCNSYKQAKIIPLDPTRVPFAAHFAVQADGAINGLTADARKLIDLLDLNHPETVDVRRYALTVLRLKRSQPMNADIDHLFRSHFGYPAELPDLTRLKPPGGNTRPRGLSESHHAKKSRGELPAVY